ncbi:MAG: hypothetical protein AAGU19_18830 [Prolixibacteraceae bacterium]
MNKPRKKIIYLALVLLLAVMTTAAVIIIKTRGRTQIQVNIRQNQEAIYASTFAEPPQFAIWLENIKTGKCQTVFVTRRAGAGDWEGKADVPVALPRWTQLFKGKDQTQTADKDEESVSAITGATPKDDYFSVRAEVTPGSRWICWIEMNLAGDYNDAYPEQDIESLEVDEFSNGQPALLFKSELTADEGLKFDFSLAGQSLFENGEIRVEPAGDGITTAKEVFDEMNIEIIRPKPKLINPNNKPKETN